MSRPTVEEHFRSCVKRPPETRGVHDITTNDDSDNQYSDIEDNVSSEKSDAESTEEDKVYGDDHDLSDSDSGEDNRKERDDTQESYVCYEDYAALKKKNEKLLNKPVKNSIVLRVRMKPASGAAKTISVRWIKTNMCKSLSVAQLKRICKRGINDKKDLYILIECFTNVIHARVPLNCKEYRALQLKRTLIAKIGSRTSLQDKLKLLERNEDLVRQTLAPVIKLLKSAKYRGKAIE